ncbi:peptidylprolyl isomerase [Mesorhizobium sp. VNQ89]|uniref:peptidylprolyl isomerase n=1 Tax=Mesorhizobium quangtriensis TaxID=3157709 RepID=UPI0032B84431
MSLSFRRALPVRPRHKSRLAELALSASLLAALTFPSAAQEAQPAEPAPAEAAQPAPAAPAQPDPNKVVATIAGQPVTEADMALALASVDQQYAQLPPEQRRAAAFMAVLEIKLLAARAVAEGLDKDPDFEKRMAFLRDRALHSEVIEKDIAAKITDGEVRARYDKQISETPPVNEVHARHILVETKEEAEAIIKQLEGGADFVALANEHTKDPSGKTSGGDLGYFAPGQMVPEFEKAAFALEVGGYTKEPVQSQFGWHIIKVEDKRAQQPPAFEQVKDQIRNLVFREKYFALVDQLRKDGNVDITDPELKTAVDAMDASTP